MDRIRLERPGAAALPRAPGLPLLGSLPALVHEQLDYFERAQRRCGGLFEVDLGLIRAVIVADPELAEIVFIKDAQHYDKGEKMWEGLRDAFGNGLAMSEGEHWRRQRRLMNPQFRRERIEGFRRTIAGTVDELLVELADARDTDGIVDIAEWTPRLLNILTLRILFGTDFDPAQSDGLEEAFTELLDQALIGIVSRRLPPWLPLPGASRFEDARALIDGVVRDIIAARRRSGVAGDDLLGLLIEATDGRGAMSDEDLRDEVVVTYLAGYETTAWSLAWGLWLLADQPALVRELQAALDHSDDPTQIPLVDASFREAMRLYPSAPFIPRRATQTRVLGGRTIPAGAPVFVSPWLIHRDPKWWPQPTRFAPRRFLDAEAAARRHKLAWMPFGAGQRICIGKGLAMLEGSIAMAELLRQFTPRRVAGEDPRPRLSTTLRPRDGIRLRLEPR